MLAVRGINAVSGLSASALRPVHNRLRTVRARRAAPHRVSASFRVVANASTEADSEAKSDGEVDIYRDTPLRYMGYANECGEAFAAWLPGWGVPASYGVAALYVCADTADKSVKAYNETEGDGTAKAKRGAAVALDTFTWQMLASVFWPGSFIRCVVVTTGVVLSYLPIPEAAATGGVDIERLLPTLAGLCTIPLIVTPIDETIDKAMEMSVSKVLNGKVEGANDIAVAGGVIGACLVVPPTLFTVAATIGTFAAQ